MTDLKKRLFAGLLALVLLCAPLSGCAAREAERYDVLASTAPVRAMTAALLEGTGLNCGLVVTESVSCLHDYTLTVAQMEKIGQADVVVLNGLGLEEFMEDALRTAKRNGPERALSSNSISHSAKVTGSSPNEISIRSSNCVIKDSGQWIATGGTAGRWLIWWGRIALLKTPSVVMLGSFTVRPTSWHQSTQSVRSWTLALDQNLPFAEQPREAGTPSRKPVAKMLFLIRDWDFALSRPSATSTPIYIE